MIKDIKKFEFTVGDKVYHFFCDADSPIQHAKEALCQFLKTVSNIEDSIKTQLDAKKASETEKPLTDISPEVTSV